MDKPTDSISDAKAASVNSPSRSRRRREGGIIVLGILHIISGCWRLYHENKFLGYGLYYKSTLGNVEVYGKPVALLALDDTANLAILAAGIGLLFSARWGWWLAGFIYSYVVCRSIYMIAATFLNREELQQAGQTVDYSGYVYSMAIFAVLLYVLYRERVLRSFGLEDIGKGKTLGIQIGLAILALAATTLLVVVIILEQGTLVPYFE